MNTKIGPNRYNLKYAVKLPHRESKQEWIAYNIFDFHKQICMLYGTINEFCTKKTCPQMRAGQYEYLWSAGPKRESVKLSASEYIHRILDWVQEQLDDEEVFPSISIDKEFKPDFIEVCKTISKRLLRVYAHIYHHHLHEVRMLKEEPHVNTSLKHFIYFIKEFDLVSLNDLNPLMNFVKTHTEYPSASFD